MATLRAKGQPAQRDWPALGLLVVNLCLALSYVGLWLLMAGQDMFWRADFSAFYTGWSIARDGLGAQLYDLGLQASYQQRLLEGRSFSQGLLPYLNPPYATLPFIPLAWLPRATAFWLWALAQLALLFGLVRTLARIAQDWPARERALLLSAALAFPPLLTTFMLGTFSLLMLVCLLQWYLALKAGRSGWAAGWLVLGAIKPQLFVLPAVVLLAGRRWRALALAGLWGAGLVLISALALSWQSWLGYLAVLGQANSFFGVYGIVPTEMYNLKGTLALLLGNQQGPLINQISLVVLLATVALTCWLWRGPWRPDLPQFEARLALTLLLGLLGCPHLHPQDGLLLLAPALLLYLALRELGLPRRGYAALVLGCPLLFLVADFTVGGALGVRVQVLVMLVLMLWAAWVLRRAPTSGDAPPRTGGR